MVQVLHEQIRITRPGGTVSAVACFCQTDGLPHYHGRYPLPGNQRLDDLSYKLWQVFRRAVRPRLLGRAPSPINQELLWEFKTAGLSDVLQIAIGLQGAIGEVAQDGKAGLAARKRSVGRC